MKKIMLLILAVIVLCAAGAAQAEEEGLPAFTSIRDMVDNEQGYLEMRYLEDSIVLVQEKEDTYYRMVTLLDDRAKELYRAAEAEEFSAGAREAFEEYAWTLPLSYIGELPEAPLDRAGLDALKGRTLRQLMDEGFGEELIVPYDELAAPTAVSLVYGFYIYQFEVDNAASGYPEQMTVRNAKFNGLSDAAFDISDLEILPAPGRS